VKLLVVANFKNSCHHLSMAGFLFTKEIMKVKFTIDYRTHWGQNLYICGSGPLGDWEEQQAIKMYPATAENWEVDINIENNDSLTYKFFLKDESNGSISWEFGDPRVLDLPKSTEHVLLRDYWRSSNAQENALYTSPFQKAFFKRDHSEERISKPGNVRFQIRAPRVGKDYQMGIIGRSAALGDWDHTKVILMSDKRFPVWTVEVAIDNDQVPLEYKYVIYSVKEKKVVTWEAGDNRYFPSYNLSTKNRVIIQTDEYFNYPVGHWKCAGVAMPVFSLKSEKSGGVGEFADILPMVDWAVITGMKIVQILPVNDTVATGTWSDSYPYAAISVHALHPMYVNMQKIGSLTNVQQQEEIDVQAKRLNDLPEVDYEAVMSLKMNFLKVIFQQIKTKFLNSNELKVFIHDNESWITAYAVFSFLRDKHQTPDFTQWGEYATIDDKRLLAISTPGTEYYEEIALYYFIQYHLDLQLKEASSYARGKGIVLKGDIPIGIYRNSVDAWRLPHLFNMDCQAGAPPDDFSVSGQNWGFPTYNWEEMAQDGFSWWTDRMVKMSEYFDVFRIDHILGFFRIWEIPWEHVEGLMGRFNPSLPFTKEELSSWGISFDWDRFCKPYIRTHMIYDIFGNHAENVFEEYLHEYAQSCYQFKESYSTQRKLKDHFDDRIKKETDAKDYLIWLRNSLYRLHSDVIFMEAPLSNGEAFSPRIAFHNTYSYQELDGFTKERLNELYTHFFYKRHNDFWRESALRKLPMLKEATDMLICGEDLGMVPDSVPGVMDELQILSLAIQRMPNDDREFWHPSNTPFMSVTSTGSHDMSTLREWWQEDMAVTQRFFNSILNQGGKAPYFCEPWVARDVLNQHLHSPSMLAIFPLQDFLAIDGQLRRDNPEEERINVPSIAQHYWRYRMHLTMEQLLEEEGFNSYLRQLVDQGGRQSDY
jgi:4-alpha-glucanotransferase